MSSQDQSALSRISLDSLQPHPENPNFMKVDSLTKLRRHIEETGRYEPLVVRPHPSDPRTFQIVNGNNRLRVLRALDYEAADCLVWKITDDQARLYLATLNRLCGGDVPERRAVLLESLLGCFERHELSRLLPEDKKQIERLERIAKFNPAEPPARRNYSEDLNIPVIVSLKLEESEAKNVDLALDVIISGSDEKLSRGQALARLAKAYLKGLRTTA